MTAGVIAGALPINQKRALKCVDQKIHYMYRKLIYVSLNSLHKYGIHEVAVMYSMRVHMLLGSHLEQVASLSKSA